MDLTRNKPTVLVIEPSGDEWLTMQWAFGKAFQQVEPVWIAEPALAMLYLEACLNSQEALPKLVFISLSERHHEGGIKFLKLLKAHPLYGDIPVIVFTESRAPALIKAIYASSANACIYKPASYQQWRSCLEQLRMYWWDVSTLPQVPYGVF